jgi:hypothetical protein
MDPIPIKPYSTSIEAAFEVAEKICGKITKTRMWPCMELSLYSATSGWWATFWLRNDEDDAPRFKCFGLTAPHAICLAALEAKGLSQ